MNKKIYHNIYAICQYVFHISLLILSLLVFYFVFSYRFELLKYFDFNIIVYYISTPIFILLSGIICYILLKVIFKLKDFFFGRFKKFKKPSYISTYGEDYPKPLIEEFGITSQEYRKLLGSFKKHEKVREYQNALKIYLKIQEEKRNSTDEWF